jgi:hypothetical protein
MNAPTDTDLGRWRRLIGEALKIARRPAGPARPLLVAADRAFGAVMPVGHQGRAGPFYRLAESARRFCEQGPPQRADRAARLGELARTCSDILTAPGPQTRRRADIDDLD